MSEKNKIRAEAIEEILVAIREKYGFEGMETGEWKGKYFQTGEDRMRDRILRLIKTVGKVKDDINHYEKNRSRKTES